MSDPLSGAARIAFCNSDDKAYQRGLNALLSQVFFDFSFWYDLGLWDQRYESYAIVENGLFLANLCVFKTDIRWHGAVRPALSLGAVTVHPEHRGKGYARALMEYLQERYPATPVYLSANESVLDFYPRFGFRRVYGKLPVTHCAVENAATPRKLAFDDPKVADYVRGRTQFSAALDCANTDSITMFHIHLGPYRDCLYELPEHQTLLVAEQEDETLHLIGMFARRPVAWHELLPRLPFAGVRRVTFGFMPDALGAPYAMEPYEADPFFVRGVDADVSGLHFPELSLT
jgi:GNAT superfamily N-acetyltransferase